MGKSPSKILGLVGSIKRFFTEDIWDIDFSLMRPLKRFWYAACRSVFLTVKGFIDDRCTLQASALTYITLVSIVPILAITLAFCKGIGLQEKLLESVGIETIKVTESQSGEQESHYRIIPKSANDRGPSFASQLPKPFQQGAIKALTYMDRTNFAALGIIGLVMLLCSVIASIKKLENNFNTIWCVSHGRPLTRQFSEYLVILLMTPLVLTLVLSLDSMISADGLGKLLGVNATESMAFGVHVLVQALMFLCFIGNFIFLYVFMPNTKVRIVPAIVAGVVTALISLAIFKLYVGWQVGLARSNAIYGTFAALPFFMAWLYAEWVAVLLGAELCYAVQNYRLLRVTKHPAPMEPGLSHLLGIVVMNEICNNFSNGQGPWDAMKFSAENNVAITELNSVLDILKKNGLVIQRGGDDDVVGRYDYVPGRPPEQLSFADVSQAFLGLENRNANRIRKCLPERYLNFIETHQNHSFEELKTVTFVSPVK